MRVGGGGGGERGSVQAARLWWGRFSNIGPADQGGYRKGCARFPAALPQDDGASVKMGIVWDSGQTVSPVPLCGLFFCFTFVFSRSTTVWLWASSARYDRNTEKAYPETGTANTKGFKACP